MRRGSSTPWGRPDGSRGEYLGRLAGRHDGDLGHRGRAVGALQVALLHGDLSDHGLFGHSLGEIVSGFVDGCLTLEETILVAHCRVKSLKIAEIEQGAMASIGLSLEEALKICPQGVTIGCHNSIDNVTISGSPAGVESTVKRCESSGIFAKGVPSFGYAFHSPSMDKAAPHLRESLSQVIGQPKKRSAKWVSTSVSRDDPVGEHCSAEYQIRNFCSMVRFQEAMMRVPENAIVIEIGPHSILFPLLKRSLSSKATLVGIQNRREKDNCLYLLKMLGQLYNEGLDMDLNAIYRFRYPVPRGTPMLSPQIVLDHSQQWFVPSPAANAGLSSSVVEVDLSKEEFDHLKWVRYGGEPVIPPEAFLVMVWEALAKRLESDKFELDVSFTDVRFHGVKFCGDAVAFDLNVEILSSSGRWEVSEGGRCLAEGTVHITEGTVHIAKGTVHIEATKRARAPWDPDEIYQELSLRGCECAGAFRCMEAFWGQGGVVSWQPSLVPFLHNVFQTLNLTKVRGQEGVLTGFGCLRVSPKAFLKEQAVEIHAKGNRIWGNCLEWTEIQTQEIPRKQFDPIPLSAQIFTPFLDDDETYEENEGLEICLKIVLQQFPHEETLRIVHFTGKGEGSERIRASLQTGTAKKTISLAVVTGHADGLKSPDHSHLQIWEDMAHFAQSSSYKSDFALVRFADGENPRFKQDSLRLVAKKVERTKSGKVFTWALLKEGSEGENAETVVPVDAVSDFSWVESLQDLLKDEKRTGVCLQSENHPIGLFGLVNSLGREFPAGGVRAEAGPRDSGRFLVQNFHQDGKWGTYIYRDLTLARPVEEKAEWSVTERERGGLEWVCRPRPVGEVCKVFAAGFDGSFAGTDSGGRRVMGLVVREEHGVVASFASPESDFVWEIPSCWSYEEAAAIPFSYAVGFAAFQLACGGRSDAHVLLTSSEHPLVGCFVAIAESVRCKLAVLVETVDSECSGFVGYSDPDAVPWKSVDAVFVMDDDWDWVKARKSELTVVDLRPIVCEDRRSSADLAGFASYHRLSLDFIARCSELRARVSEAVKTGIKSGVVKPLPFHDVNPEAFSADVRFRGDAVMSIRSVDGRTRIKARKQLRFESEEVVIITGGLGGMGLELVQFLIDHGAQKFLLTSRRGVTSGRQGHKIGTWRSRGIQVRVSTLEISTEEQAKALIQEGSSMGHLVGIFHLAGTLRDGRFVKAGRGDFESVAGPKVGALQCVDRVSREWCPGLKYFVAFSSVVVGVGNVGQTAYGMANGAMEDVIRDRRRSDCPGLAIEWGPIAEVGMASKILARTNKVSIASCRAQSIHASWDRLETLLLAQDDLPSPIVTVAILEAFEPEPEPEHVEPKEENLLERVAKVLDMPLETLDPNRSLAEMGLDSMASVHIEQMFKPMHLSLEEIAQLTLRKVQALISSSA
ncbi:unnamed protein product [Darwinula stevensoni]|uniref:Carrier domain-containing protein n=1 Tax=Darwinula stevensoni TaxID=69355 RepID=A0A7R9AH34_9CRUS|nr:unnamed protein product [Darwinula stevensoni]CAG0904463.1 unnamed protein product [Darwinula stevensoni]